MKLKIGVLTNMPTPYRRAMWSEYLKVDSAQMTYFYCSEKENDRYWEVSKNEKVNEIYLKGFTLKNTVHFNFEIIRYVRSYDAWIIGGYNTVTAQVLIILCKLFNIPYILMVDGINPQKLDVADNGFKNRLKKFYITGQTASLANGTVGRKMMLKYGMNQERIFNQFLTVDINSFIKQKQYQNKFNEEIRYKYSISNDEIVLLYVGRLIKDKGIQDAINVINKLREQKIPIKLLIVGEGNYRKSLESLSNSKTGIIFTGEISYDELPKYYYASDILILPTYDDVWGLTINEGMACGLPIITTNAAGAYLDLIKNNGYVYEAGNETDLERCIFECIGVVKKSFKSDQIELVKRRLKMLGEQSVSIISEFSFDNSVKEFGKLINFLTNKCSD